MNRRFEEIARVETRELYDMMTAYGESLIDEATLNGWLDEPGADNEYTREIGRVGCLCADYESEFMTFKHIRPLRSAPCRVERRSPVYEPVPLLHESGGIAVSV
jgi:hypothetical protein